MMELSADKEIYFGRIPSIETDMSLPLRVAYKYFGSFCKLPSLIKRKNNGQSEFSNIVNFLCVVLQYPKFRDEKKLIIYSGGVGTNGKSHSSTNNSNHNYDTHISHNKVDVKQTNKYQLLYTVISRLVYHIRLTTTSLTPSCTKHVLKFDHDSNLRLTYIDYTNGRPLNLYTKKQIITQLCFIFGLEKVKIKYTDEKKEKKKKEIINVSRDSNPITTTFNINRRKIMLLNSVLLLKDMSISFFP